MATTGNKNINAKLIRFSMLFPSSECKLISLIICLIDNIFNTIAKLGFTEPTPIQAQGWPMALKGEEPVSLTKRRFRSKNIEPIPFGKMQGFNLAISPPSPTTSNVSSPSPCDVKVGEEPVSLTKRRFRSKNIEPIPFWKMQVVPFNGKLVKAKKRCHWCGTRGCEDLRAQVFLIRV
ncbi:hypothetical protein F2Q69_00003744 [Brassica cretica]|uniref:DEAD-box RNA helicase Q domain-containing protein n=1 Tax=Brassica cretica TaxID=69181 RepID=A0A8S9NT54_BRACR|nr:hypothetical protein F2Q69_00003744 [Brassica cretica]